MYQKYSQKAKELRLLGMSYEQIAKSLKVSRKTVINAYNPDLLRWGRTTVIAVGGK